MKRAHGLLILATLVGCSSQVSQLESLPRKVFSLDGFTTRWEGKKLFLRYESQGIYEEVNGEILTAFTTLANNQKEYKATRVQYILKDGSYVGFFLRVLKPSNTIQREPNEKRRKPEAFGPCLAAAYNKDVGLVILTNENILKWYGPAWPPTGMIPILYGEMKCPYDDILALELLATGAVKLHRKSGRPFVIEPPVDVHQKIKA